MSVTTETIDTGETRLVLLENELIHLISTSPAVRYQLIGATAGTFAERTDLQAILERIDALRKDFNRQFAEHSKRMDALREDFNRGFNLLSGRVNKLERTTNKVYSHLGAMGARWGMQSESAFREGLADILAHETGLRVANYLKMDPDGFVFGQPDQIEIDIVIQDGKHTLIEIKSSTSRQEVHNFSRKVKFYEKQEGVQVERKIIISPMPGPGAVELADELGIETFTSVYDVSA